MLFIFYGLGFRNRFIPKKEMIPVNAQKSKTRIREERKTHPFNTLDIRGYLSLSSLTTTGIGSQFFRRISPTSGAMYWHGLGTTNSHDAHIIIHIPEWISRSRNVRER